MSQDQPIIEIDKSDKTIVFKSPFPLMRNLRLSAAKLGISLGATVRLLCEEGLKQDILGIRKIK